MEPQLLASSQEHGSDVQLHPVAVRGDNVRVLLDNVLDASHEELFRGDGEAHLLGATREAFVVPVGSEHYGRAVPFAVAFETFRSVLRLRTSEQRWRWTRRAERGELSPSQIVVP